MATNDAGVFVKIDLTGELLAQDPFRAQWSALLEQIPVPERLYASPEWAAHFQRVGQAIHLVCLHQGDRAVNGIATLCPWNYDLKFTVKGKAFLKRRFSGEWVLGSIPLVPPNDELHDTFFAAIREKMAHCECLYMEGVPTSSHLWSFLHRSEEIRNNWILHVPDSLGQSHYIDLPATFRDYLQQFSAKTRHELEREHRVLGKRGPGPVELVRVETHEQIPDFVKESAAVIQNAWLKKLLNAPVAEADRGVPLLTHLADRGSLRSYILKCGSTPCAMAFGYQERGIYHYCETGYDARFAKLSPGKVMLFLMIEDMIGHNRPDRFYFGPGHMAYKDWFANASEEIATVVLFRKTLKARLWCGAHRTFHFAHQSVRTRLKRQLRE